MDFTTPHSALRGLLKRLESSAPEYLSASSLQKVVDEGKCSIVLLKKILLIIPTGALFLEKKKKKKRKSNYEKAETIL